MKKNFKCSKEEINSLKENKNYHMKVMARLAFQCLIGVAALGLGADAYIRSNGLFPYPLVLTGGPLTCGTIGLMIREHKRYKNKKEELEKGVEGKVR